MSEEKKNKKWLWWIIGIVAGIILIASFSSQCQSQQSSGIAGKYIGTDSGETLLGQKSTWETVLELKASSSYTLTVTHLQTGSVTLSSSGTYKLVGEGEQTIIFTDDSGKTYQAEYSATGHFITFGYNSGFRNGSGLALSVRKK